MGGRAGGRPPLFVPGNNSSRELDCLGAAQAPQTVVVVMSAFIQFVNYAIVAQLLAWDDRARLGGACNALASAFDLPLLWAIKHHTGYVLSFVQEMVDSLLTES